MARKKQVENDVFAFLDLSHFVFQRYYAIQRWAKISGKGFVEGEQGRKDMIEMFTRLFEQQLTTMKKKLGIPWSRFYLAQDCPRENIWRMSLFGDYKKNRVDKDGTSDFDPIVFVHTYNTIIPELKRKYGIGLLHHPRAEADDVIAIMHGYLRSQNPEQKIIVITNDNDYVQLHDSHTTILNSNLKDLTSRFDAETLGVFGLWKAIRGDDSDNIPAIDKKVGDKVALKLATCTKTLEERCKIPGVADRLELNKKLIMFEFIPDDIRKEVVSSWEGK